MNDKERLAQSVVEAYAAFNVALHGKRGWPRERFHQLFSAVTAYATATTDDRMIHRDVARCVNGLREYLEVASKSVPGAALFDADRLETILFAGYDPSFDGDEPPGL